jgi:DNA-binding MarR family transcriptional regulator
MTRNSARSRRDSDVEGEPLSYLMHRLLAALREQISAELDSLNVAFPQYICLRSLGSEPGQSNADLARTMKVSPQAMNIVLTSLQDAGLVTRPDTVGSGRARPAKLSSTGAAVLNRADAAVQAAEKQLLATLTQTQRLQLRATLCLLLTDDERDGQRTQHLEKTMNSIDRQRN